MRASLPLCFALAARAGSRVRIRLGPSPIKCNASRSSRSVNLSV